MRTKARGVTNFYSGSRTTAHERKRSAMLAGAHAAYEVRRIFTVSTSVRIKSWRCEQECRRDACESRHAYPGEHETSLRSLFLVENLTMKKGLAYPMQIGQKLKSLS